MAHLHIATIIICTSVKRLTTTTKIIPCNVTSKEEAKLINPLSQLPFPNPFVNTLEAMILACSIVGSITAYIVVNQWNSFPWHVITLK